MVKPPRIITERKTAMALDQGTLTWRHPPTVQLARGARYCAPSIRTQHEIQPFPLQVTGSGRVEHAQHVRCGPSVGHSDEGLGHLAQLVGHLAPSRLV